MSLKNAVSKIFSGSAIQSGNKKTVAYGRSPAEKLYIRKIQQDSIYNEFLCSLSIDTGFSEDELEAAIEPLCLSCWKHSRTVMTETEWSGDVLKLQEQVREAQDKLNQCNLSSMKAISNLQARKGGANDTAGVEEVQFHESLAYLDPLTRELVSGIIVDKVSQIADSMAESAANGEVPAALASILSATAAAREAKEEEKVPDRKVSKDSIPEVKPEDARRRRESIVEMEERRKSFCALESVKDFESKQSKDQDEKPQEPIAEEARHEEPQPASPQTKEKKPTAPKARDAAITDLLRSEGAAAKKKAKVDEGDVPVSDKEIQQLKTEIRRYEEDARRQTEAIKRLERALEESKSAAAKAAAKLAKAQGKLDAKAGKPAPDQVPVAAPAVKEEVVTEHVAKKRSKKHKDDNMAPEPIETQTIAIQTTLTGEYLEQILEASANLQATVAKLTAQMAVAAAEESKKSFNGNLRIVNMQTEASLRAMQLAHDVFIRLWDDALLRDSGLHRRERAPYGPKPEKPVKSPRAYSQPRPFDSQAGIVSPSGANQDQAHQFYLLKEGSDGHESENDSQEPVEELDIQGTKLDDPSSPTSNKLDDSCSPRSNMPSPKMGIDWELRPVRRENLPVLQGPAFVRHERKTVSLALLAPTARTSIETERQHPLFDLHSNSEKFTRPVQGVENVCDFLRRRREARSFSSLPATNQSQDTEAIDDGSKRFRMGISNNVQTEDTNITQKRYLMSRLGASASLPMLAHDT